MLNRSSFIKLVGRITAVGPLSISLPPPEAGAPPTTARKDMFPTMPVRVGDAMVRTPIIPSTSVRGKLRRCGVEEVVAHRLESRDGSMGMGRDDYQFNAVGGIRGKATDAAGRDIHLARDLLERNVIVALFGAGEIFVQGLLAVKEARLEGPFEVVEVTDFKNSVRRDDLVRDPELLGRFSDEDVAKQGRYVLSAKEASKLRGEAKDLKRRVVALSRQGDELDAEGRASLATLKARQVEVKARLNEIQTNPESEFKEQANTLYGFPAVAAGSTFAHEFRLEDPSLLQTGLFLAALRRFSRRCTIGGKLAVGCGEVRMEYAIHRHDGVTVDGDDNPVVELVGHVVVERDNMTLETRDPFLLEAVAKWREARAAGFPGMDFKLPSRGAPGTGGGDDEDDVEAAA